MGAQPSHLSSRAEPRDLQCALRPSRILRNKLPILKQKCHPDRSAAQRRDLLFIIPRIESEWERHPPLCHPERSRGICSAPFGPREFCVTNSQSWNRSVIPTVVEGPAVHAVYRTLCRYWPTNSSTSNPTAISSRAGLLNHCAINTARAAANSPAATLASE